MLATVLLSHAGDGTVGETWPLCDVDADALDGATESCWRWRCWGDLAVV
jgi:hypothetical protein